MKITILHGAFFPVPALRGGAIGKAWDALGQSFSSKGHEVTHVSRKYDGLPEEEQNGNVRHLRVGGFNSVNNALLLKIKEFLYVFRAQKVLPKADLLVTHAFWAPLLLPKVKFGKIYVHVGRYPKGQLKYYKKACCFQVPTKAIGVAVKEEISSSRQKISVLPYPLNWKAVSESDYLKRDLKIFYLGRIHPEKGVAELIQAFNLVPTDIRKNWKLSIRGPWQTGQGGGGKKFINQLRKTISESSACIELLDPVFSESELKKELKTARIFAYPSLAEKGETFGLSVLEAMSCGCIPIVSALECFKDLVENNKSGYVFDHKSKHRDDSLMSVLSRAMQSENHNITLSEECLIKAKNFELDEVSASYLDDFSKLLTVKDY